MEPSAINQDRTKSMESRLLIWRWKKGCRRSQPTRTSNREFEEYKKKKNWKEF